jgi:hypothetical protein
MIEPTRGTTAFDDDPSNRPLIELSFFKSGGSIPVLAVDGNICR